MSRQQDNSYTSSASRCTKSKRTRRFAEQHEQATLVNDRRKEHQHRVMISDSRVTFCILLFFTLSSLHYLLTLHLSSFSSLITYARLYISLFMSYFRSSFVTSLCFLHVGLWTYDLSYFQFLCQWRTCSITIARSRNFIVRLYAPELQSFP